MERSFGSSGTFTALCCLSVLDSGGESELLRRNHDMFYLTFRESTRMIRGYHCEVDTFLQSNVERKTQENSMHKMGSRVAQREEK